MIHPGQVLEHPALRSRGLVDQVGYTLPVFDGLTAFELNEDNRHVLRERGVTINGRIGERNLVIMAAGGRPSKIDIYTHGKPDNVVIVGHRSGLRGNIVFEGKNHLLVCSDDNNVGLAGTFRTDDGAIFVGKDTTAAGLSFWVEGPGKSIIIGDDCMFSYGIFVRTSQGHGVIDLKTRMKTNRHEDVVIGAHVWVGQNAQIGSGIKIGAGSIIGTSAIVTKDVSSCVSVGGIPARVIKTDVSWTRSASPSDGDIVILAEALGYPIDTAAQ